MSMENMKVPVEIALRAGDVLVAVSDNPGLWSAVLAEIMKEIPTNSLTKAQELKP